VRLRSVEVIPYALPFREPYVTARGTLARREMVLLRLTDEDGVIGLGEAVPLSLRGGATLAEVVGDLEAYAESRDEGAAMSLPARCAVSCALLDLRERQAGKEADMTPVRCNATLVAGEPAAVAGAALAWAEEGYGTFKLKLGAGNDVGQVRAVREALGDKAQIRIDANEAWDLEAAARVLAEIEPFGVQLAEQPVTGMAESAELARRTAIPLAGDESVVTIEDATQARAGGAFALTGIKLSKVGGLLPAWLISGELPGYVSSSLDGPVGIALGARAARAMAEHPWPASGERAHGLATQRLFASTIAATECELRDGNLHPPPGPGLGIEIDEDALAAHRL
jgi:o-succinylbenzoate synthase